MRIDRIFQIFLVLILFIPNSAQSQGFLKTNGKAITNESGDTITLRGMGLGGWMLQEGYMLQTSEFANSQHQIKSLIEELIGETNTEIFYDAWLSNHVQKQDIDSLKAWGFNSVRLPMHYNLFTLPIEEEPVANENTWLNKGFELTDSLLSWCKSNNMYVILDLHAAPGGQGYDEGISDYDPSKPSLWESQANKNKTVALWKRIAEHYANEPYIAGYDLINETNWNLAGNSQLRALYHSITNAIRLVDQKHILFIEGNWFANDFTGLTPPWDDNMVYSPHKYWSKNDQASIQWVLDMRDYYNVPLYLGESGENSNVWFRDAIRLFEDNNIGWAWWPLKKVEAIAGPLSIIKTDGYQDLLDYWGGTGPEPSPSEATAALMELTENLKIARCVYQKDVIDAMFRQVNSEQTVPFKLNAIPGVISCSDYDMGPAGFAYSDTDLANYHVTTGNYTAWNLGWTYRNDGVDIERCLDSVNSNGYDVGWTNPGEWLQYTISVAESAAYDVNIRVASDLSDGSFHIKSEDADISPIVQVPSTGGYQNWQTVSLTDLILTPNDNTLRLYMDGTNFNISSMEFVKKASIDSIATSFVSAKTSGFNEIHVSTNKPIKDTLIGTSSQFLILVNGSQVPVQQVKLNTQNDRIIEISIDYTLHSSHQIRVSYTSDEIIAIDDTPLREFTWKAVQNNLTVRHSIPGTIRAEDYSAQSGIELENTSDIGGGQNIGYLDVGDFAEYLIEVPQSGMFKVSYRTASESQGGELQLMLIKNNDDQTLLHTAGFNSTGGWQSWVTSERGEVFLPSGIHKLRIVITEALFNINWIEFSSTTAIKNGILPASTIPVFPNPTSGLVFFQSTFDGANLSDVKIFNTSGQIIFAEKAPLLSGEIHSVNLTNQIPGTYYIALQFGHKQIAVRPIILH